MNILGISAFGFNPAACLVRDGELIAFVEEERFTRVKCAHGAFPIHAIRYCLKAGGIDLDAVDAIAMGWDAEKYRDFMPRFFESGWKKYGDKGAGTRAWEQNCVNVYNPDRVRNSIRNQLLTGGIRGRIPEIHFIDHHLSHAASTFFPSGMQSAAILTIDGSGEDRTTCLFKGDGADIVELEHYQIPESLGWFYSTFTQFCGFRHNMDEGKLMGLAPYGKRDAKLMALMDKIVRVEGNRYTIDPFFTYYGPHAPGKGFAQRLVNELGPPREPQGGPLTDFHRDVAWAAQEKLEQAGFMLAKHAMELAGSRNLCISGGVALNCKMNGVINQKAGVNELFVQPISSDAGTALGAALWYQRQKTGNRPPFAQKHLYYGPGHGDDEIESFLKSSKLRYVRSHDIGKDMADRLAAGKLAAWFQGRMEAGPRALGHRSILAHPGYPEMKAKLNGEVKHREMWRPFCPSILAEKRGEWLVDSDDAPYMIVAQQARPDRAEKIPSVVHVDGSVRPQTIEREIEPLYHHMISHFEGLTGLPLVVNTSFNIMGEPVICNPAEAVRCFYSTGLDAMAIGSFLLEK
jgi:carbamoyltransferase